MHYVVQNSGRWGDEYTTFLTDTTLFAEVEEYIKSKLPPVNTLPDSCDPDADLTQLNEINGYPISDYYEHDLNPKYKVGDIVWAWTKENNSVSNYDESNKGYVLTRIKIDKLSPNHPYETYGGSQIDRYYEPLKRDVIFKENSDRPYYAYLNDRLIIGKVEEMPIPSLAINYFVNEEGKLPESYKFEEPIFPKPRPKM